MNKPPELDPIFHQVIRTKLSALISTKPHSFSQLKSTLNITDGNLDSHLRKLSAAGYLHSEMILDGRPHTIYSLSENGYKAFQEYKKAIAILLS